MPVLKNARHEQFAQALAKGMTAEQAYTEAGFKANRHNAAALARKQHISTRVEDIRIRVSDKAEWTAADRLAALKRIHSAAEGTDPRTAISAIAEANKMQGAYPPAKHQLSGTVGTFDLTKVTDADLAKLEAILGPIADAGGNQSGEE